MPTFESRAAKPAPQIVPPDCAAQRTADAAAGLEAALRARAAEVFASTPMVRELAVRVCQRLTLSAEEQHLVDVCARVRDVGVIGLPDDVVLAAGPLSPVQWGLMNRHPAIGADMLEGMSVLREAAPIVRAHHERWDGDGYPEGLRRDQIPLLSRIIAVCDAFVAMATDRPHRRGVSAEAALERIEEDRGHQFDPHIAGALVATLTSPPARAQQQPRSAVRPELRPTIRPDDPTEQPTALKGVLARLDAVPAFGPAIDRLIDATSGIGSPLGRDLIATVEGDIGLTVAILRAAQRPNPKRQITAVTDALRALTPDEIRHAAEQVPRATFPWRTPSEGFLHQLRIHSQAVYRAAQRLGAELSLQDTDDLLAAALVHDVGKLAIAHARPQLASNTNSKTDTPEQRIQTERRALSLDHASLGGLLLTRWGLPESLSETTAAHHTATDPEQTATRIRLADLIAHQAHNDAVDPTLLIRLATDCGLSSKTLRDALFDLPHAGGSRRVRAQPSPLSQRETDALRRLAEGKVYSQIAQDLGLATSTVRSHLHSAYSKLQVADRAQAVLRASEMGWI